MEFEKRLSVEETGIDGLKVVELSVHGDNRGWFKENWQRAKMVAAGIPDLHVVQNNISFNAKHGVTRGIHAEPWDKFISVARGSVFGAWVDLRQGSETFGRVYTTTLDPSRAIYVPRGVGNSFQALEDGTAYTYLVDAHWSAELKKTYTFVNLADPELAIEWPIPLEQCELSEADRHHPMLKDVIPMAPRRTLVTGCRGQLGRAVRALADARGYDTFDYTDIDEFDFSDPTAYAGVDWGLYGTVINCGAYTAVDKAETPEGRVACWRANATQSKAAGDLAVAGCPRHYIARSSWVIGDGHNFVKTMAKLSDRVADETDALSRVTVVDDQLGRLTFTDQMAEGILHLLESGAPFGTYDLTGEGATRSWYKIASRVFGLRNGNADAVVPVSTAEYYSGAKGPVAPRPHFSTLDLARLEAAGFTPRDWEGQLAEYVASLPKHID